MSFATRRFGLPKISGMVARMSIPITPALAEWLRGVMGDLTHDEIHDEMGGPSSPTLTKILKDEGGTISRKSARLLELVFDLPRGRVAAIARGEHVPGAEPATDFVPVTAGEMIAALRRARGWSLSEMAIQLDVGPKTLGMWEKGTIPVDRKVMAAVEELLRPDVVDRTRDLDVDFRRRVTG